MSMGVLVPLTHVIQNNFLVYYFDLVVPVHFQIPVTSSDNNPRSAE